MKLMSEKCNTHGKHVKPVDRLLYMLRALNCLTQMLNDLLFEHPFAFASSLIAMKSLDENVSERSIEKR